MGLKIGGASQDENGGIVGAIAGDQKGNEVRVRDFYGSWQWVIRAKNPAHAMRIAELMINACDNDNLGYSQPGRNGVFTHGINATVPTGCDCSSLVSACVAFGLGVNIGACTTRTLRSALVGTGLFDASTSMGTLYTGDIMLNEGSHTEIIVSGNPRTGSDLEALGTSGLGVEGALAGLGSTFLGMINITGGSGQFIARTFAPRIFTVPSKQVPVADPQNAPKPGEDDESNYMKSILRNGPDLWFTPESMGGYSHFGPQLTNETYAWCRSCEIMNQYCTLHKGLAEQWYRCDEDGYERNMAPTVGSVMCFGGGDSGYVCIVEDVTPDGITTSEVTREGTWQSIERTKRYGSWNFDDYIFQGFIHNPGVGTKALDESALETFLRIAEEKVGSDKSWVCEKLNLAKQNGWSAAFVTACSAEAGSSLNIVIPNTISCSSIGSIGVLRDMGEWLPGPAQGESAFPEVGDIVLFRRNKYSDKVNTYVADGAGIVTQIDASSFTAVEGVNSNNLVTQNTYQNNNRTISGYFRPKWEQIDGTTESVIQYRSVQGLYTEGVRREDACAREVGYMSTSYKPSINPSGIRLSAVNYTGLLQGMYSVFGTQMATSDATNAELIVDFWTNSVKSYYQDELLDNGSGLAKTMKAGYTSYLDPLTGGQISLKGAGSVLSADDISALATINVNVDQNRSWAYHYLKGKALPTPVVIGILANIEGESHFNTAAVGDYGTSFGICQWHNNRGANMKNFVGADWATNLQGQLDFLLQEFYSSYRSVKDAMMQSSDNLMGACQCTDIFVRRFEVPANVDSVSETRQGYAKSLWESLVQ